MPQTANAEDDAPISAAADADNADRPEVAVFATAAAAAARSSCYEIKEQRKRRVGVEHQISRGTVNNNVAVNHTKIDRENCTDINQIEQGERTFIGVVLLE